MNLGLLPPFESSDVATYVSHNWAVREEYYSLESIIASDVACSVSETFTWVLQDTVELMPCLSHGSDAWSYSY